MPLCIWRSSELWRKDRQTMKDWGKRGESGREKCEHLDRLQGHFHVIQTWSGEGGEGCSERFPVRGRSGGGFAGLCQTQEIFTGQSRETRRLVVAISLSGSAVSFSLTGGTRGQERRYIQLHTSTTTDTYSTYQ